MRLKKARRRKSKTEIDRIVDVPPQGRPTYLNYHDEKVICVFIKKMSSVGFSVGNTEVKNFLER